VLVVAHEIARGEDLGIGQRIVRTGAADWRRRYGAFATLDITHYQYLRFEASRYHREDGLRPVHRVLLQYDAVIGYHTHGVQR